MDVGIRSTSHASSQISEIARSVKQRYCQKLKSFIKTANKSVSNVSVPSAAEESDENEELISDDDDDEYDQLVDDQSETINIDTLLPRIRHWRTLESSRDDGDGQS